MASPLESMKTATLNIGEIHLEKNTRDKYAAICEFLNTQKIDVCFLQETRLNIAILSPPPHEPSTSPKEEDPNEKKQENQPKEVSSSLYDSFWSECYPVVDSKGFTHQHAGTAILIRKKKEWKLEQLNEFNQLNQIPTKLSFKSRVTAVKVNVTNGPSVYLINVYAPARKNYDASEDKAKQQMASELFYEPFCNILKGIYEKVKENNLVIVAGDMNGEEFWYKEKKDCFIQQKLTNLGFQMIEDGSYNKYKFNGKEREYKLTYIYFDGEWHTLRYDYFFYRSLSEINPNNPPPSIYFVEIKFKDDNNKTTQNDIEQVVQQIGDLTLATDSSTTVNDDKAKTTREVTDENIKENEDVTPPTSSTTTVNKSWQYGRKGNKIKCNIEFTAATLDMTFSSHLFNEEARNKFIPENGKYYLPHFFLTATFPIGNNTSTKPTKI